MNPFWMVLADLRKTLLSSLGILVLLSLSFSGTVAVSLFERALLEAGAASAQDYDLVVGAPGSKLDLVLASVFLRTEEVLPLLPFEVVEGLQDDPRVEAVSPLVFADHFDEFPIVGVGPSFPSLLPNLRLVSGRWPQRPFEAVAGAATASPLHREFSGSHGAARREGVEDEVHNQASYRVVGLLAPTGTPWDRAFLTPYNSIWALHEAGEADPEPEELETVQKVSAVLVKPKDFASAYALRSEYQRTPTTAAFPGEVLAGLFHLVDQAKTAVSLLGLLFQAVVFAAVLLSLLAGLPSKARWIGLLRALGASPAYVFLTLWIEAAVVFLSAGLTASGLGWLGAQILAGYVGTQTGLDLTPGWAWEEARLLGLFWAVGLVGSLVPALVGYSTSVRRSLLGQ